MLKFIRRIIIMFMLIIIAFILQNTLSVVSRDLFVTPNFIIILTCIIGYIGGSKDGMLVGFTSGMIVDLFASDILGMNALLYLYVGFISGLFNRLFFKDMIILPLAIVCGGDFVYNFGYYIFRFLLRNKLDFSFYMWKIILPEMIFTTFLALVSYQMLYFIYTKWLMEEQRSTLNFD